MKNHFSFSICVPVYKGSDLIRACLESIVKQEFDNYEIVIAEDTPPQFKDEIKKTQKIIRTFQKGQIRYYKNKKNLGYPRNLKKIVSLAKKDVIFFMSQDDILATDALQKTHDAFLLNDQIGAVTRPYFWFDEDMTKPVRAIYPPNQDHNTILSIFEGKQALYTIFESLGQVSGLALRKKYIAPFFFPDIFTAHIYFFAGVIANYKCVYLKDFTIAVRIRSSHSRTISSVYDNSPLESWVRMFSTIYKGERFDFVRKHCVRHIASHYIGLLQIKNFGSYRALVREIFLFIKFNKWSLLSLKFWLFSIITLVTPRFMLVAITDNVKKTLMPRFLKRFCFNFN